MRGVVTGTSPGDSVEVWFEGGGERSDSFTYRAVSETGRRVLVVAAEDYIGRVARADAAGRTTSSYYLNALQANGVTADVYDVDARGRIAPDHLGVLSHYDAVDLVHGRRQRHPPPGWAGATPTALAMDEILEFRAYMNEGGRVLYTGAWAGQQYVRAGAVGQQFYDPKGVGPCLIAGGPTRRSTRGAASALVGSPNSDGINDVLEYWLGAYAMAAGDGHDPRRASSSTSPASTIRSSGCRGCFGARRRGQPEHERVVRLDERHPAAGRVPAVQQLAVGPVGQAGRAVLAAHRHAVRLLADRRRHLQAADPRDRRAGRRRRPDVLDARTTPSPPGTTCSSRPGRRAATTGRRCRTPTATRRRRRATAAPAGWRTCTRSSTTTRRSTAATATARRPARPASGTPPPATPAAGSSGGST